jgi:Lrp/AsnC family transcriptional regulator, leucine-responsive regulatory protein
MNKNLNYKPLDELSAHILEELQLDARLSITEIGRRIGLSGPAVAERIKRMEEEEIITGYRAIIDHDKIGLTVNAFITLKSNMTHATAAKKISEIPEITECYNITGNNCVIMKVATPTTKRLEAIIGQLQMLGETNTSIILSPTFDNRIIRRN